MKCRRPFPAARRDETAKLNEFRYIPAFFAGTPIVRLLCGLAFFDGLWDGGARPEAK